MALSAPKHYVLYPYGTTVPTYLRNARALTADLLRLARIGNPSATVGLCYHADPAHRHGLTPDRVPGPKIA